MWDDVGKSAGGQDFLKIEAGSKVKLHVLSEEPYSYKQVFFNSLNRGAVLSDETAELIEDKKSIRPQHSFVVRMDDGAIKVWNMGNRLAEMVKGIFDTYGSLAETDLVVSRTGTEKNTKYMVTPVPTSIDISDVDVAALPNLEEVNAPASAEDIEKMIAGIDPSAEFDPSKLEAAGAEVEAPAEVPESEPEAEAPPPARKPLPKPLAKPPIKMGAGAMGADPRAPVVKEIMLLLSKSVKYKTPMARQGLMKKVAPGKTTVGAMTLPELQKLKLELKK